MSWFTDIAGKAEDFLNKIDQNAAEAINKAAEIAETRSTKTSRRSSPRNSHATLDSEVYSPLDDFPKSENLSNLNFPPSNESVSGTNGGLLTPRANGGGSVITVQEKSFVSSGSPLVPKGKEIKAKSNSRSRGRDGKGGSSSPRSGANIAVDKNPSSKPEENRVSVVETQKNSKKNDDAELIDFLNDPKRKELDENLVLQTELANQAREVELLYKTNKQLQSDNETFKSKLAQYEDSKSKETMLEEFESQLRQSDRVQKNLKKMLLDKDEEIVKLKKSLDQSLEKLQQLEVLQTTQNRLEMVEMEKQKLLQSNEELREEITGLNERTPILNGQLASMKTTLAQVESEFTNYKEKAKSILKQKDDLITSLQEESAGSSSAFTNHSKENKEESPYLSEINALKSERELLNAEISQCRSSSDSIREDTQRLESELLSLRSLMVQLQKQLYDEKSMSSTLQDENLLLRQQLSGACYELDLEKSERRKLEEWKAQQAEECQSFNNGRNSPNMASDTARKYNNNFGGDNEETLRMRITALTQSLLEKQGLINSLSSDKQLLQINVERLQDQLHQVGNEYASSNNAGFSQTVISSKPLYLSESPWDSGMSTSVKRAFSTVDSLFCQAGIALRRRPNLRLGFCVYILLLHFWVLFILFHTFNHVSQVDDGPSNGPAPSPI
ncbi:golgin subfamily A member 5 [Folsomia candida]|nr:golgin subfamily A member 5 [Folsomia candida]